jgi:hypothetical protein
LRFYGFEVGALLAAATAFRDANIVDVTSYDELKAAVAEGKGGFIKGYMLVASADCSCG